MENQAEPRTKAPLWPVTFSYSALVLFAVAFWLFWRQENPTTALILCALGCLSGVWAFFIEISRRCWPGVGLTTASFLLNTGLGVLVALWTWLKTVPVWFH